MVKLNPVSEVKNTTFVNRIGMSIQKSFGQVFSAKSPDYGVGVTVENPRFAKLEEHFKDVTDIEYNTRCENLIIIGELMGVAGVDY